MKPRVPAAGTLVPTADSTPTARQKVDKAFAFDRGATRLLYLAESRVVRAEADLAGFVDSAADPQRRRDLEHAVETATAELALSTDYRTRCREALDGALDGFGATETPVADVRVGGYSSSSAAAAVVAEATAIAAVAEEGLADEVHTGTIAAARIAEQAVADAAATVAEAAESSRRARQTADALAAADVAAEAAVTAAEVQVQADLLAAVTAAAAQVAADQLPHSDSAASARTAARLATQVVATAQSRAAETAAAAHIVAAAVTADAAAVAIITSAAAASTEHDVRTAARAVQAVADVAARELAVITSARDTWQLGTPIVVPPPGDDTNAPRGAEYAAIGAATTTAAAAQQARAARASAAIKAAYLVAEAAARTADAVQTRAMELAVAAAALATAAAETVSTSTPDAELDLVAEAALRARSAVIAAAIAGVEQTTVAAARVARSVAAAAESVAARNAAAETVIEGRVRDTALAMEAMTANTAVQLAQATRQREAAIASATRASAAAEERLWDANHRLDTARQHDRAVALALQQAMHTELPQPAGLTLAGRYRTADAQDQVGGDWYDALLLPSGSVTLMVGDVVGHDIAAAAMMGQLRNILRTLVWERPEPASKVVARLDEVVRDLHLATLATLILVNVDAPLADQPASVATLRWANAGHPAPILAHTDGTGLILDDATDVMLGVDPNIDRFDHAHPVPAGATLLLYTDGLIESRSQPHDRGRQRLLESVRAHHDLDLDELLDAVLADMIDGQPTDDIAVLAVRFSGGRSAAHPA